MNRVTGDCLTIQTVSQSYFCFLIELNTIKPNCISNVQKQNYCNMNTLLNSAHAHLNTATISHSISHDHHMPLTSLVIYLFPLARLDVQQPNILECSLCQNINTPSTNEEGLTLPAISQAHSNVIESSFGPRTIITSKYYSPCLQLNTS